MVIGIGSAGIYNVITRQAGNESEKNIQSDEINASNQVASCEDADKNTRNDADQSQLDSADAYLEKKNDIGTYHLASNYEEVYKLVTQTIYMFLIVEKIRKMQVLQKRKAIHRQICR